MIESIDNEYKNIFYPTFFSFYKYVFSDAFHSKKYRKKVYENVRRAFTGISRLDVVKRLDMEDLDLAFLVSYYSYEEYIAKFRTLWNYKAKDLKLDRLRADAEQWQDSLGVWEERLTELGHQLQQGAFHAEPVPRAQPRERERLCSYCGLLTICNRGESIER